jgi:hypothetical protein
MFSVEVLDKIRGGKGKYDVHIIKDKFRLMYKRALMAHEVKVEKLEELRTLVNLAKQGLEMDEPEGQSKKRKMSCQEDEATDGTAVSREEIEGSMK